MTAEADHPAEILNELPIHHDAIESLLDQAFGPGRFAKTAYRLREGTTAIADLSFVALKGKTPIGAVRLSPITIGGTPALFLGPLVVHPDFKNKGHGLALMRRSLAAAGAAGHRLVVLVGDRPYYARAGFMPIPRGQVRLPGPVDPDRLLAHELAAGALADARGMARPAPAGGRDAASAAFAIPGGGEGREQQREAEQPGQQRQGGDAAQDRGVGRLETHPVVAVHGRG